MQVISTECSNQIRHLRSVSFQCKTARVCNTATDAANQSTWLHGETDIGSTAKCKIGENERYLAPSEVGGASRVSWCPVQEVCIKLDGDSIRPVHAILESLESTGSTCRKRCYYWRTLLLLVTSATLLVTSALLVVTMFAIRNNKLIASCYY